MAMSKFHDIDEGYTLDLLIPAFFIAVAGGIGAIFNFAFLLLVLVAVLLIALRSGVQIDVEGKRIRVYKSLGKWKSGTWLDLSQFDHVRLKYTQESQVMNARSITNTHTIKTYDLIFRTPAGTETEFHDFSKYQQARQALKILVEEFGYSYVDGVQERKRSAKEHATEHRR